MTDQRSDVMGVMNVMGPEGDVEVRWDPADEASIAAAKAEWDQLKTAGFEFFEVGEAGKGKRLTNFRKDRGRVIAAPGVAKPAERKTTQRPKAMRGGPKEARA